MARTVHIHVLLMALASLTAESAPAQDDVADIPSERRTVADDPNMSYFVIGPKRAEVPSQGYGLVVIMPGGDGGPDFHPFVKRIYKHALGDDYLAVQPIAVKWSAQQEIVWPTENDGLPYAGFSTEQFVAAVIKAVQGSHRIDPNRVFTLSWSSSGPAAYAISLDERSPVVGSYIAMSVFKPQKLGSIQRAADHAYFIDHCPQDKVCPFRMALEARRALAAAGAKVQLNMYAGGHGWQGDVYPRIAKGIRWLQRNARPGAAGPGAPSAPQGKPSSGLAFHDDFEQAGAWQRGARVEGVEYIWDSKHAHQGQASAALKKTANRYFPVAQWQRAIPCSGPATLDVSAWIKAEEARKATVDLQFLDAAGKGLGHQWAVYIGAREPSDPPANHDWKQYQGTVNIPAGTKTLVIALQIYGPGTVWFDTLAIREKQN